jgi:vacuolar-type H+-ATPase subunit D/Vma8
VIARGGATRAELLRARRLLERVRQGAALLRRKREALVRLLVPLARPVAEDRRAIADAATAAYRSELDALADHGAAGLTSTGWPARILELELDVEHVWGVSVPTVKELPVVERDLAARSTAPGPTGPTLFETANRFEELAARLLAAIAREVNVRALGAAVSRTSRQLHTLEHRVAPALVARVAELGRALAERDREDQSRLRSLRRRS